MDQRFKSILLDAPPNVRDVAVGVVEASERTEGAIHRLAAELRARSSDTTCGAEPVMTAFGTLLETFDEEEVLAADAAGWVGNVPFRRRYLAERAARIDQIGARIDALRPSRNGRGS